MFYDKKIKYLNYIVDGERIKGCGFVKVELRDRILNMEVAVNGLPTSMHCLTEVWLCTGNDNYPLGQIYLENGRGSFRLSGRNIKDISPIGITYENWKGISIFPQDGCEISGLWEQRSTCVLERVEVSGELAGEVTSELQNKVELEDAGEGNHVEQEKSAEQEKPTEQEKESRPQQESRALQVRIAEEKWEQVSGIYPHIRPFRDKREYLSIRPADFVLLSAESYKAVNNSFLLHGYYNYQHLILARTLKKGEVAYYVGTPGNFFEREKQVAIMFGFTSFECAKDPAREGDFGYYLMQVEL